MIAICNMKIGMKFVLHLECQADITLLFEYILTCYKQNFYFLAKSL